MRFSALRSPALVLAGCGAGGLTPLLVAGSLRIYPLALAAHFVGIFSAEIIAPILPEVPWPAMAGLTVFLVGICAASSKLITLGVSQTGILAALVANGLLAAALPRLLSRGAGNLRALFVCSHLSPLLFALPLILRPATPTIVVTEARGENAQFPDIPHHTLLLDGRVVFSSVEEQGDHLCLVDTGVAAAGDVRRVLILGGGDGLSARNLLSSPRTHHVQVVERVARVAELGKNDQRVRMYNLDSLNNRKVSLTVADPLTWLRQSAGDAVYDLVVIDEAVNHATSALQTKTLEAATLIRHHLRAGGALTVRVAAATDASHKNVVPSLAVMRKTLEAAGFSSVVYGNRRGDTGYVLAVAGARPDPAAIFRRSALSQFCAADARWRIPPAEPHRLLDPQLAVAFAPELVRESSR